jgi:ABC-2 type transport system ATP-binding protein
MNAISAAGLRKSYGTRVVLDGVDLAVPAGSIFCLLGPNGAGKTTTVQILSTLIPADGGRATIAGHDLAAAPHRVRKAIGVTGQFSAVDGLLTGRENLTMMGELQHLPRAVVRERAAGLLRRFDLTEAAAKPASTYSGGMKRRLDLAMSLIGDPQVVFLDEPTTGLDPRSRRAMWRVIRELVAEGVSIFLTTQYLEEADELADHVAVLDHGRVVAQGSPDRLKGLVPGGHIRLHFADTAALDSARHALRDAQAVEEPLELRVPSDGSVRSLKALLDRFDDDSITIDRLTIHTPTLDDVFLSLTGAGSEARAPRPQEVTAA